MNKPRSSSRVQGLWASSRSSSKCKTQTKMYVYTIWTTVDKDIIWAMFISWLWMEIHSRSHWYT